MNRIVVFRLEQTPEERAAEAAMRARGEQAPLIILSPQDGVKLRKLFNEPPKHAAQHRSKVECFSSRFPLLR